ncbi:MAG: alkyl hydroperoxide reductase [Gammaproteobacteria bacterium RIFCSPLOWO2_02_FULL_61_13]|nr:MAG: alkyl hydroperoxide reductase [Gammaproteobacteria bacterium RIFCSPLOWO2_02_FULL_61_13]
MALTTTPPCTLNLPAPDFLLPGTDERDWSLQQCRGPRGTLVMFICNHCPYVKAVQEYLVRDTMDLRALGVHSVAIMSNDTRAYPEDDREHMRANAEHWRYPFPYLIDASQQVARAYGAVCTPDFFGYDAELRLRYRGRLNAVTPGRAETPGMQRELFDAMCQIAATGSGPAQQTPSMGCSIKWRGDSAISHKL